MNHPTRRMNPGDLKLRTLPCATFYVSWWKGVTRHKTGSPEFAVESSQANVTTHLGAYSIL